MEEGDLKTLEQRIESAKSKGEEPERKTPVQDPFRIGAELVGGVLVGSFLGYYADKFFSTTPLFFIIFFFVGVIAGFYNIYRLANREKNG